MVRRLTLSQVSKFLQATADDIIAAAIEGEFKVQIPLRDGTYQDASIAEIKRAMKVGFFEIGKYKMRRVPKGTSDFDRMRTAPDRAIWPEQISIGRVVFLETEIRPFVPKNPITKNEEPAVPKKTARGPRLQQRAKTERRNALIIAAAEKALESEAGPTFYQGNKGINKSRIGKHILKNPKLFPDLATEGLTKDVIRTALANAQLERPE
jgi:hypothetical protein